MLLTNYFWNNEKIKMMFIVSQTSWMGAIDQATNKWMGVMDHPANKWMGCYGSTS